MPYTLARALGWTCGFLSTCCPACYVDLLPPPTRAVERRASKARRGTIPVLCDVAALWLQRAPGSGARRVLAAVLPRLLERLAENREDAFRSVIGTVRVLYCKSIHG